MGSFNILMERDDGGVPGAVGHQRSLSAVDDRTRGRKPADPRPARVGDTNRVRVTEQHHHVVEIENVGLGQAPAHGHHTSRPAQEPPADGRRVAALVGQGADAVQLRVVEPIAKNRRAADFAGPGVAAGVPQLEDVADRAGARQTVRFADLWVPVVRPVNH